MIVSINRAVNIWISEAKDFYCLDHLPANVRKRAFFGGKAILMNNQPSIARKKIWDVIGQYADRYNELSWFDFVKPPVPDFLKVQHAS